MPLHPEAVERLELWLDAAGIREHMAGALFPAGDEFAGPRARRFCGQAAYPAGRANAYQGLCPPAAASIRTSPCIPCVSPP